MRHSLAHIHNVCVSRNNKMYIIHTNVCAHINIIFEFLDENPYVTRLVKKDVLKKHETLARE